MASIRDQVLTLPDETVLFPGHGPPTTVGQLVAVRHDPATPRLAPSDLTHEVAHDGADPGPRPVAHLGRPLEGLQPGVLHQLAGGVAVAHEVAGQLLHPGQLALEIAAPGGPA